MIPAGMINQRIHLLSPTWHHEAGGQRVATYPTPDAGLPEFGLPMIWAKVEQVSARQAMRGQQVLPIGTYRLLIRWRPGLDLDHRIYYRGMTLEIATIVDTTQTREALELVCHTRQEET